MKAPNHIAGGFVFTGIFCSLFSINVFANPLYITTCIIASLIPDIDLMFFLSVCFFSYSLERYFLNTINYTTIVFFAVLSHLIFDMLTLQGIPLFYPFKKNACVIPANQNLRIRTDDLKAEGIILFFFALCNIFLLDLYKDGFWTNLNKKFNDIEHTNKEFQSSENLLNIEYEYSQFNEKKKGIGKIVNAEKSKIYL